MRSLTIFSTLLILMAGALMAQPVEQQKPISERIEVNAVLIDAVVTDSKGNQILGLDKNDFVVTEDGRAQTIDSLDYFTSRKLLNATEANAPFKVEQVREERYIVFFFDKPEGAALFDRLAQARADVTKFIDKHMVDGDRVAIVGHDVRLKVYSDFTSDKAQLKRALDDVARFGKGVTKPSADSPSPSILRAINADAMMSKTGTVYEAITELSDALKPIKARKNLVLFSPGILEPGDTVRGGVVISRSRYYDPMMYALNAANVTVYAMNLQSDASQAPAVHQTLDSMTRETNGDYYRYAVTFKSALDQVAKASAGYYLLTYRTQKQGRGFQKVDVSVRNHPEFKVAARSGYTYGD
jgi:VWFA-related protein